MKFVWKDGFCSDDPELIAYEKEYGMHSYHGFLYDDNGKELESILIQDYSTKGALKDAVENRWHRPYAYEVNYCNHGYSMKEGFDEDTDYYNHFGWKGTKTMTVDDVKRWCEEYIASLYIIDFDKEYQKLLQRKEQSDWFTERGYGQVNLEEEEMEIEQD